MSRRAVPPRRASTRSAEAWGRAFAAAFPIGRVVSLALAASALALAAAARAQVVYDDTLTTPGEAPLDPGGTTWQIEPSRGAAVTSGGRTNLFYSFERFDVPLAHAAEFRPQADVRAIVSRVTGGLSRIDGDVRVAAIGGGAGPDLILVNPAGVLFSGSTRIDLGGAFRVSSASAVGFADGGFFSATDPAAPLPSAAAEPSLLRFDGRQAGDVRIEGNLRSNGATGGQATPIVSFVGRDVKASGQRVVALQGATVELGAVGTEALDVPIALRSLDPAVAGGGGRVELDAGASAFQTWTTLAPEPDQGRIVIRGGELVVVNTTLTAGGTGSDPSTPPAIDIAVAEAIAVEGAPARIESLSSQTAGPGSVSVRARSLAIEDGGSLGITSNPGSTAAGRLSVEVDALTLAGASSEIASTTRAIGPGGAIEVRAGSVRMIDGAAIASESLEQAGVDVGPVGDITVGADSLAIEDGAEIRSISSDAGAAGAIALEAETIALAREARVLTETRATGAGGDVTVRAASLALVEGASISTGSAGDATSGAVRVEVGVLGLAERSAIGTGVIAPVAQGGPPLRGPGGDVSIAADSATVTGGSQISTSTDGAGDAGDLMLDVRDALVLSGRIDPDQPSGLFARSGRVFGSGATGDGGRIVVRAGALQLMDGAQINSTTTGAGRAGGIDVATRGDLVVDGGRVSAISTSDAGATGDVRLAAGRALRLVDGAEIVSEAPIPLALPPAPGDPPAAGGIDVFAHGPVFVENARIATDSARPESGDVRIASDRSVTLVGSSVTTNVSTPSGRGGDIALETHALALAASSVTANASTQNADAGNVTLRASQSILQSNDSVVEANAELGVDGLIVRATPETNLPEDLARFAVSPRLPGDALVRSCRARESEAGSFRRAAPPVPLDTPDALLPEPDPSGGSSTPGSRPNANGPDAPSAPDGAAEPERERDGCPQR
ncbi:MAG: filamentous hemagglutinin N-terminal domain-containing protein [Myxococcota bacterium]